MTRLECQHTSKLMLIIDKVAIGGQDFLPWLGAR